MNDLITTKTFLDVPVINALNTEISKYKVKKKTLLDKNKDSHTAFGQLWEQLLNATNSARLKEICAALIALTNDLKVERNFPFLTLDNSPKKTLGYKIENILQTHEVAAQYFVFYLLTALKRYKVRNPQDTIEIEKLEAELSVIKNNADVIRVRELLIQRIHQVIATQIHLTSDQKTLVDEVNRRFFEFREETVISPFGGKNTPDVTALRSLAWVTKTRREDKAYDKQRKAAIRARKVEEASQFLKETLDAVEPDVEIAIQQLEAEYHARLEASRALADIAEGAEALEEIGATLAVRPEVKIEKWNSKIDQKTQARIDAENAMKKFHEQKESKKACVSRSLDLRIGIERNILSEVDVDVSQVDKKIMQYKNESSREATLHKLSQKWWDKIIVIRALPSVRRAREERRDRIKTYLDAIISVGNIVTALALPQAKDAVNMAQHNMETLAELAKNHDPHVMNSLLADFGTNQQRIREFFHYHELFANQETKRDTLKKEIFQLNDAKLECQSRLYEHTLRHHDFASRKAERV